MNFMIEALGKKMGNKDDSKGNSTTELKVVEIPKGMN